MKNTEKTMDKIVALCKNRGFVFPGSEIYGGLANTWDYGPLGAELKNNIKRAWWKKFVQENPYNVGLDAAILMNPQTWVASGHLGGFSDPLMDCRECHERFRADKLIEDWTQENGITLDKPIDAFSQAEMKDYIEEHNIPCPTARPSRRGRDTQSRWSPWSRSTAPRDRGHGDGGSPQSCPGTAAIPCRSCASS